MSSEVGIRPSRKLDFLPRMAKQTTARRAIPPLLKDLNERTVLEAIRDGAPISRAEISRRAGISKPTVSLALQSLLESGLVREAIPRPEWAELRRDLLRARPGQGARARPRPRRSLPPRRDLRPARRDPGATGRRARRCGRRPGAGGDRRALPLAGHGDGPARRARRRRRDRRTGRGRRRDRACGADQRARARARVVRSGGGAAARPADQGRQRH